MNWTRRNAFGAAAAAARRAFGQQVKVLPPVKSQSDVVVMPSNLPGAADRALERARDLNQADAGQFGPHRFLVNASTNQRPGAPFRLAAAVIRTGRGDRYRGPLSFRSSDPKAVLPRTYEFTAADDRFESHVFEATLHTEGRHTITARDEISGRDFSSNVILVARSEPKLKLYFGDIHFHSQWSFDGRLHADEVYGYAREAMNMDFASLTEHDPPDEIWARIQAKANALHEPGKFVTICAYEWTANALGEGHKNVYYRDSAGPIYRSNYFPPRAQTTSAADLWDKLRKAGKRGGNCMTLPHHPAARAFPTPWNRYDPEFQRCVEVYSTWGNSEYPGGPRQIRANGGALPGHFIQDGLAAGQRVGFVGGSDSHSGRPGYPAHSRAYFESGYTSWEPDTYTGGLTAVYAPELSREAVFDAIYTRHCYATTGKRIILDFRIDDRPMGSEFQSTKAPQISVKAIGTAPIESVTVIRNNQDYLRVEGKGKWEVEFDFDKTEPPEKTDFYYVRVQQQDYEMAWASPIWIGRG